MTTLVTGELSGFDDDSFRVGREHALGKGVAHLAANEVPTSPNSRPERSSARMSPVFDLMQRAEAHGFIDEGPKVEAPSPSITQPEIDQSPATFTPVPLWEVVIGDTKATSAEIKEAIIHALNEAVAGAQLTSAQAEVLWLELVDGQDATEMDQSEREAVMKDLYEMYAATLESTPFAEQPEYAIPYIKYTRATKDRGPKTIPEIKDDLNRLEIGSGKVRREAVVLQIAGVMQTVLETAKTAEK